MYNIIKLSCSSNSDKKNQRAELYFNSGTQSLMDKDYTMALTSLLKANQLSPKNSSILTNLGMAYYFKGEKDLAIQTLKKALELDSENADSKVNLASIYYHDKNYALAEKLYKQVLKNLTYDKQARTYYNLGLIEHETKRDLLQAEKYYKLSIKEDENYCPSYFQLGIIQFTQKKFNTALKSFREAGSGTCYEAPAPHYHQGLTLIALRKFDEARLKFDEIESRFKKSPYANKARIKAAELKSIELNNEDRNQNYSGNEYRKISF